MPPAEVVEGHGLVINRQEHSVRLYEEELSLTPTEFEILWLLCDNAGSVVSSEKIFETIWKEEYLDSNNTVMVHIRRLREFIFSEIARPAASSAAWEGRVKDL